MEEKRILHLLIFGIVFILFGCSEDLYETENLANKNHQVLVQRKNFEDLKKDKKLMKSIEKFTITSSKSVQRQYYDSINNFYIDLDDVMFTQDSLNNKAYTFKINRTTSNSLLENLILKTNRTGNFDAILAQYNQTILNSNLTNSIELLNSIDQNVNFVYLGKKTLLEINSKFAYNEECFEPGYVYTSGHSCASGEHSFAEGANCDYWGTTDMATISGYVYTMVPASCGGDSGGDSGSTEGGFSTGPHGGGGSEPTTNPCNKIKNQNTKFPSIQQSLSNLSNTTNQNYENGIFIDNTATATTPNPVQTIPSNTTAGGSVPLNMNPPNKYAMIAHTHDVSGSDGIGTFSIFSWGDLLAIANLIHNNHIDDDSFVFYVITADGTKYAMTIDWPKAFAEYFDITTNPDNPSQTGFTNWPKSAELSRTSDKYYNNNPLTNRITRTSNPIDDQKIFLKMIKDLKLDVTLFEVDATFTNYTKLVLENNTVIPKPCK